MSDKTKAYLRIAAMAVLLVALIIIVFVYQNLWLQIPSAIIAVALVWILYRTVLSILRKKHVIYGKVLSITKPKNKINFGKTTVVVKAGKVSKKLYSWQPLSLKVGSDYGFYYEDKSDQIIKYETLKLNQMARPKGNKIPPQYR